jgi:phosphoribosylamine-glycine ligase
VRVCVLGGGDREHALAWAAARFGHYVVVVPGNGSNPWSAAEEPSDADSNVLGSDDVVCSGQGDRLRAAGHLCSVRTPTAASSRARSSG